MDLPLPLRPQIPSFSPGLMVRVRLEMASLSFALSYIGKQRFGEEESLFGHTCKQRIRFETRFLLSRASFQEVDWFLRVGFRFPSR